jgi:hypothetical protein
MKWWRMWLVAILIPVVLQLTAILTPGDEPQMLSEHVIPLLMEYPALWLGTFIAYITFTIWLGWHWWWQYRDNSEPDYVEHGERDER